MKGVFYYSWIFKGVSKILTMKVGSFFKIGSCRPQKFQYFSYLIFVKYIQACFTGFLNENNLADFSFRFLFQFLDSSLYSASIPGHEVWVALFKITIFLYTKLLVTFLATLIDFLTENNLFKHNFLYFPLE